MHHFLYHVPFSSRATWQEIRLSIGKNPTRKDPNIQLLIEIEQALVEADLYRIPYIYIRPEIEKTVESRLREILDNRRVEIVTDEEDATHIVYPAVDPHPEEYARPIFKRGNHVMLHWYMLPESYDSWTLNGFDLPENIPENPESPAERWRVGATWILDLEQYNEWMAEEDYEVDELGKKKMHKQRMSIDDIMSYGDDKRSPPPAVAPANRNDAARLHPLPPRPHRSRANESALRQLSIRNRATTTTMRISLAILMIHRLSPTSKKCTRQRIQHCSRQPAQHPVENQELTTI